MKLSEDPRSPFSLGYRAKINWRPMQQVKDNGAIVTKNLEKARMKDPLHDVKKGISSMEKLLPKQFHVYAKAGAPKK